MNKKTFIKKGLISTYKGILYLALFLVFNIAYGFKYKGLTQLSRTLMITSLTFFFIMFLMIQIYGGFDIGEKKSKPILISVIMNIFFTDVLTLVNLKIMSVSIKGNFSVDLIILLMVLVIQSILIYVFTYVGNFIYFKLFNPIRVTIVHNQSRKINSLLSYFKKHGKQFEILDDIHINKFNITEMERVQQLYLLDVTHEQIDSICNSIYLLNTDVFFNAQLDNGLTSTNSKLVIDDILMYKFPTEKMSFLESVFKRIVDLFIATLAMLFLAPITILIAIAIKMDDGGPVFYRQERLTINGKVFKIVKFRSMKLNSGNQPAKQNDDRITKVGNTLRKYRLDEIPQFINIFNGDMSIVGPRPESTTIHEEILNELPEFNNRLKVKAGLTGYAQIFGKYNTSPESKLILDLEYIENFSFFEDIRLIFQTVIVFFKKDSTEGFTNDN